MKKIAYLLIVATGLYFASCTPDKKDDPVAPSTDARDNYVGTWQCNETGTVAGSTSYPITISKSTANSSEILLSRFYDIPNQAVRASVSGNNITIPYQQLGTVGFAQGTGTLVPGGNLSLAYTTTVSSNTDNCTATCVKQ